MLATQCCTDIQPTSRAIHVTMPDGPTIKSTHEGNLPFHHLPLEARKAHLFPELTHHSLISVGLLCNNGCTATITRNRMNIRHNGAIILTGQCHSNGLWVADLLPRHAAPPAQKFSHAAINSSTIQDLVQFLHAALFSPVPTTLIKVIENNRFTTWPGLTVQNVKKCLPKSNRHGTRPPRSKAAKHSLHQATEKTGDNRRLHRLAPLH
jgi:hypothetical protein